LSDEEVTDLLNSPRAQYLNQIFTYSAVGDTQLVKGKVNEFLRAVEPDELMVVHHCENTPARLRSMEILAEAMQ
jgi:hypothetical protein